MRDLSVRLAIAAASLLLAGVGFVAAAGFFCVALYLQLATMMEPPLAATATAFAALLFSVLVMLIGRWLAFGRRRMRGGSSRIANDPAMEIGRRLGEEAFKYAKTHRRGTLIATLLAGFAVGASPKLRNWLRGLIGL
jgi:hypothetical protein